MKSVFITGASQGLGAALAAYFSRHGYYIYAGCHSQTSALPGPGRVLRGDIADENDVHRMFSEIETLDVLVNNARLTPSPRPASDTDLAAWWDKNLAVSLKGTYLCSLAAFDKLQERGGAIINVSSIRAKIPNDPDRIPYGAAKAGQLSLTASLAKAWGKYNIRVNALLPGAIETPKLRSRISNERYAEVVRDIPLGRMGDPEEICHAALFLAENTYTTGAFLNCSGGLLLD